MAREAQLHRHVARLATILRRFGADTPGPTLRRFSSGERAFLLTAALPGPAVPNAAEIRIAEVWRPAGHGDLELDAYAYEFLERPLHRRRAFHLHDPDDFLDRYGTAVHEHCEEVLGYPACEHYYGLPTTAYRAIQAFLAMWGQPEQIGCADLRCMA